MAQTERVGGSDPVHQAVANGKDRAASSYSNLSHGEIRVFDLLRSNGTASEDRIDIRMRTIPLDGLENYFTLSYTWGEAFSDGSHLNRTLYVDGHPVRVTENLYTALEWIREIWDAFFDRRGSLKLRKLEEQPLDHWVHHSLFSRVSSEEELKSWTRPQLWVDALCINQGDHREQSAQVRMMGDSYANSRYLLVWLGEAFSNFDADTATGDALINMLESPWFKRLWVVQEVFHKSRKVSMLLKGWLFDRAKFHFELSTKHKPWRYLAGPLDYTFGTVVERDLLHNLHRYSYAKCSDPRDTVFALLSISTDGGNIVVDYQFDVLQVYFLIAEYYVSMGSVTRVLAHAAARLGPSHEYEADRTWPSWIPDWRHQSFDSPFPDEEIIEHPSFLAEKRTEREKASTPASITMCSNCGIKHSTLRLKVCIIRSLDLRPHDSFWEPCKVWCDIDDLDDLDNDEPFFRRFLCVERPCPRCRLQTAFAAAGEGSGILAFILDSSCAFSFAPVAERDCVSGQACRLDGCWDDVVQWQDQRPLVWDVGEEVWKDGLGNEDVCWTDINVV